MKVLLNSFHLNGHTLGFHPQTQKLQPHLLTQGLTLGEKGLIFFIPLQPRQVSNVHSILIITARDEKRQKGPSEWPQGTYFLLMYSKQQRQ